jgi:hypothetical protein
MEALAKSENRRGDWMQVFSGRQFWPLDPRPEEIEIEDIAHALSMQCRYAGHTKKFYSVAEHSLLISQVVSQDFALWGLLHDASEAYLTDIIRPIKPFMSEYKVWEKELMRCIAIRFGLEQYGSDYPEPLAVKRMDARILWNEQKALMGVCEANWSLWGEPIPNITIKAYSPATAKRKFLERFNELAGVA